jgi:hypothetical protein
VDFRVEAIKLHCTPGAPETPSAEGSAPSVNRRGEKVRPNFLARQVNL